MRDLPTGTITRWRTAIEGSTALRAPLEGDRSLQDRGAVDLSIESPR